MKNFLRFLVQDKNPVIQVLRHARPGLQGFCPVPSLRFSLSQRFYQLLIITVTSFLTAISIISCSVEPFSSSLTEHDSSSPAITVADNSGILEKILSAKQIRIAVPQDFPPFGVVNSSQKLQGYDVDVARILAEDLQVELKLVPVTSDRRIESLLNDEVDVVIANLGANPQRALSIYFSKAYAPFYSGIYGTPTVSAATYAELEPYRIGVTENSLEDLELTRKAPPTAQIRRYTTNALTIEALLDGTVNAIATSNVVATKLMQDKPEKNIGQKFIMRNSPCYIGIRRGDLDFLQWLNVFVTNKKLGGELDALAEQWFGEPLGDLPS